MTAQNRTTGQVIVGVDNSLAALRALREAVEQARRRGVALLAVRAFRPAGPDYRTTPGSGLGFNQFGGGPPWELAERQAQAVVEAAFTSTLGGFPSDLPVQILAVPGFPGHVLVKAAHRTDDLLVVGMSRGQWWPSRHPVSHYCTNHAGCPVLVVPPPEGAADLDGGWLRHWWWRHRELPNLTEELLGVGPVKSP